MSGPITSGCDSSGSWIDRTNMADTAVGAGYHLPPDLTDLCLTNNRLTSLDGLANVPRLHRLVLRQNALTSVPDLSSFPLLEEVDLYINQIATIPPNAFRACTALRKLDLSFNALRDLSQLPVASLPNLTELYLISNKIKAIGAALHSMPHLTFLELGDNRIRVMEGLDNLPALTSLWLGRNKIAAIDGLHNLPHLQILSLQSNRITQIPDMSHLAPSLTELYLSHNGIEAMGHGLSALRNLRVLDLSGNQIVVVEGVEHLVALEEFWANDNMIESLEAVGEALEGAAGIETVYLEGNPCAKSDGYMHDALRLLPDSLSQLDALPVPHVRKIIEKRAAEAALNIPATVETLAPEAAT